MSGLATHSLNSRRSFAKMQLNYFYLDTIHIVEVLVICTKYHNLYSSGFIFVYKKDHFSDKYSFSINCNFLTFYCSNVTEPKFVKAQDLLKEPWIINHFLAVNIHVYLFCGQMKKNRLGIRIRKRIFTCVSYLIMFKGIYVFSTVISSRYRN